MQPDEPGNRAERLSVEVPNGFLEVVAGPVPPALPVVCAAHPAGVFGESAVALLRGMAGASVVCVNPRGIGQSSPPSPGAARYTLESMADDVDAVRQRLGIARWVFWGMSGGGWLGQACASRYPDSLTGLILESTCSCFRLRLADPVCILSPFHPSWRPALERVGLIAADSHTAAGDADATEWIDVDGVGAVFRRRGGPALLVSPTPVTPEMRAAMPLLWTVDLRGSLRQIRAPTLVIGGSADPIAPLPHVRSLHDAIAGSTLLTVDGGGHVPTTARSPEVREAVRSFLHTLAGSAPPSARIREP